MSQSRSLLASIALVVSVGLAAAVGLDITGDFEAARSSRSFDLERARADAYLISAIEWQAIAEGEVSAEIAAGLDEAADRLREAVSVAAGEAELGGLADAYVEAVRTEFDLVTDGEIERAKLLDSTVVDPRFDALMDVMSETAVESRAAADLARTMGRVVTPTVMLVAVLVISALLWYVERSNRSARLLLEADAARKTEFVALASHELRTPLTAIVGFSELLVGSENLSDAEREFVQHIHTEGQRLTRITSDLLNVARIDAGHSEFDISDVDLRDVVDVVLRSHRSEDHVIEALLEGVPVVRGHREKLVEVLGNLVDNAVKYSPNGGRVTIRWELTDRRRIRISVTDEGLGVPEAELPRLFSRFHRIERAEHANMRSTGLGLYLVNELVTVMGGEVGARSVLGRGSTFWFTLRSREALAEAA